MLDIASKLNPQLRNIWEEKLKLCKSDEKKVFSTLKEATKVLSPDDALTLWEFMLDNVESKEMVSFNVLKKQLLIQIFSCFNVGELNHKTDKIRL